MAQLTLIEFQVLELAARGQSVDETATLIQRARGTVKGHRAAVLDKLGARNMVDAVRLAHEQGLLGGRVDPDTLPATDGQRRAFFAKSSDLDLAQQHDRGTTAKHALADASDTFRRPIASVKDLTRSEISDAIDQLQRDLDEARGGSRIVDVARAGAASS